MSTIIGRIDGPRSPLYFLWSLERDAPITDGMDAPEFARFFRDEFGNKALRNLPAILERVDRNGTSMHDFTFDDLVHSNRAGPYGQHLGKKKLLRLLVDGAVATGDVQVVKFPER